MHSTDQCADGKTCGDAGHGASPHITCDSTNGCQGSEDEGDVFVDLDSRISYVRECEGRGTREVLKQCLTSFGTFR